jgi:hypothetical protein
MRIIEQVVIFLLGTLYVYIGYSIFITCWNQKICKLRICLCRLEEMPLLSISSKFYASKLQLLCDVSFCASVFVLAQCIGGVIDFEIYGRSYGLFCQIAPLYGLFRR